MCDRTTFEVQGAIVHTVEVQGYPSLQALWTLPLQEPGVTADVMKEIWASELSREFGDRLRETDRPWFLQQVLPLVECLLPHIRAPHTPTQSKHKAVPHT